jgi:hypothetical protein
MRPVMIPELQFGSWQPWAQRKSTVKGYLPGVYVISITNKELTGQPVDWADVSYIGMTRSQSGLAGRWKQFDDAIRKPTGMHSGGNSVFATFGPYEGWKERLFVAAMPIECNTWKPSVDDTLKMGWIGYLEYEAFAKYREHCKDRALRPRFNRQ